MPQILTAIIMHFVWIIISGLRTYIFYPLRQSSSSLHASTCTKISVASAIPNAIEAKAGRVLTNTVNYPSILIVFSEFTRLANAVADVKIGIFKIHSSSSHLLIIYLLFCSIIRLSQRVYGSLKCIEHVFTREHTSNSIGFCQLNGHHNLSKSKRRNIRIRQEKYL
jgi:hypothetical protein